MGSEQIIEVLFIPAISGMSIAVIALWRKLEKKEAVEEENKKLMLSLTREVGELSGKHKGIEELGDRVLREVRSASEHGCCSDG